MMGFYRHFPSSSRLRLLLFSGQYTHSFDGYRQTINRVPRPGDSPESEGNEDPTASLFFLHPPDGPKVQDYNVIQVGERRRDAGVFSHFLFWVILLHRQWALAQSLKDQNYNRDEGLPRGEGKGIPPASCRTEGALFPIDKKWSGFLS